MGFVEQKSGIIIYEREKHINAAVIFFFAYFVAFAQVILVS